MSRSEARRNATSSPSRKIWPEVGSSSPAIILSVVVLPQPDGPSRQKNEPSGMVKLEFLHRGEVAEHLRAVFRPGSQPSAYSGNFETMMNIAVPVSVVRNDQV